MKPTPEERAFLLVIVAGAPGVITALAVLWGREWRLDLLVALSIGIVGAWVGGACLLRGHIVHCFQTISNLLGTIREGDYSVRGRGASENDAFGVAMLELNSLASTLRDERLRALEATALLRKVMAEMDVAVFAFDDKERLQLVNRAGERLLSRSSGEIISRRAGELGLAACLQIDEPRTLEIDFPGESGRWEVHKSSFREGGRPHWLLVIANLGRALREGEREAWRRLVRVLSHEINNSLAPIHSLAGSLKTILQARSEAWEQDLERGLGVIENRSEALGRFMAAYAKLARLPPPRLDRIDVERWIRRVVALEKRLEVRIETGESTEIQADSDQLDQLLINLVGNAVDASLETGGNVEVGWVRRDRVVEVWVDDEGPGIASSTNLFVPFFTTKPHGSGIGLVLSRQIAENHGGTLRLENRTRDGGCRAMVALPVRT